VTIPVTNGTYKYTVQRVDGYFVNVSASGTFNVSGANVSGISFTFYPVIPFLVEFTETGLPSGTLWSVGVTGNGHGQEHAIEKQTATSYGTSLNFSLPNGTYHYTVANVPGSFFVGHSSKGKFVISGESPAPIPVAFTTPAQFSVTFDESGLPTGTNWSVRVHGFGGVPIHETLSSDGPNITFSLPNGSYAYAVADVLAFDFNGSSAGAFAVSGTALTYNVSFVPVAPGAFYPVAFEESGLANGTHWSVSVVITHTFGHSRRATQSSNGTEIFFLLQNATYRFTVHEVRGYTIASGGSGAFAVAGSAPSVLLVGFTAVPTYTVTVTETGLANGTNWSVLVRSQSAGSTPWPIHTVATSNGTSIELAVPNGTYCYSVHAVAGYRITAGTKTGSFSVAGASPTGIVVDFTPTT
jgi:hypothetical protein